MFDRRGAGILLHPTSLPGPGGIGTLGEDARRFVDLLHEMGMSFWQVLPLSPPACGNSPYSSFSAFAGNPLLIDLEQVAREENLPLVGDADGYPRDRVEFGRVAPQKMEWLHRAAAGFLAHGDPSRAEEFRVFCDGAPWLDEYALFMALKRRYRGEAWNRWPREVAFPPPGMRERLAAELAWEIDEQKYLQWQFFRQWQKLRGYAGERGIKVIGDLPIFVAYDSADLWSHRDYFLLDDRGEPSFVAGVPPDYFSATGQLWGNPLYDWEVMERQGYRWWIERLKALFLLFDVVRVDHFRGFEAAWHIPAGEKTAERGSWVKGPGRRLFDALKKALGSLPIIAEDLGVITPGVLRLRDRYNFPGMKILQFAFESEMDGVDLPHNHVRRGVVYTGTHDNDTTAGWCAGLSPAERGAMNAYLGTTGEDCVGSLRRAALMSVADTAIFPLQDLLGLGSEARMNVPGTAFGNWEWRFSRDMIGPGLAATVRAELVRYGRVRQGATKNAR